MKKTINDNIIDTKNTLLNVIESGYKSNNQKIGIEFENILFDKHIGKPIIYNNSLTLNGSAIHSIKTLINKFITLNLDAQPVTENGQLIGATNILDGSISLEPAGQFEFATKPWNTLHEVHDNVVAYLSQLLQLTNELNINVLFIGINPKYCIEDLPLMPKQRYEIMYNYMSKVDTLGRNMMKQTATLQSNLDFNSEKDLRIKVKVILGIQAILDIYYANSMIVEQQPSKLFSNRLHIWQHTDPHRTGIPKFMFDNTFTIEQYIDYVLNIPMYFIHRQQEGYIKIPHITFKEYMQGKYKFQDLQPTVEDFNNHLKTVFTDVRITQHLESRTTDIPDAEYLLTMPAILTGILYDQTALNNVFNMVNEWSYEEIIQCKSEILTQGINTKISKKKISHFAELIIQEAHNGLKNRGFKEEKYLSPLTTLINNDQLLSQRKVKLFNEVDHNIHRFIHALALKDIPKFT